MTNRPPPMSSPNRRRITERRNNLINAEPQQRNSSRSKTTNCSWLKSLLLSKITNLSVTTIAILMLLLICSGHSYFSPVATVNAFVRTTNTKSTMTEITSTQQQHLLFNPDIWIRNTPYSQSSSRTATTLYFFGNGPPDDGSPGDYVCKVRIDPLGLFVCTVIYTYIYSFVFFNFSLFVVVMYQWLLLFAGLLLFFLAWRHLLGKRIVDTSLQKVRKHGRHYRIIIHVHHVAHQNVDFIKYQKVVVKRIKSPPPQRIKMNPTRRKVGSRERTNKSADGLILHLACSIHCRIAS
jgi:hypothetical protein